MEAKSNQREIVLEGSSVILSSIYPGNTMKVSRHLFVVRIIRNLFNQFKRTSHIWFLLISIFQLIPYNINPTDSWTTIVPLALLILISLLKDSYNDYLLQRKFKAINNTNFIHWNGSQYAQIRSMDLLAGHIIEIKKDQVVPADVFILGKTKQGRVFLDMSRLLGYSSLQEKKSVKIIQNLVNQDEGSGVGVGKLSAIVKVNEPNSDYNNFNGSLKLSVRPSAIGISADNMLFAGGVLKGSTSVIAMVVFCGIETKLMLNTGTSRKKYSKIEETVNFWVIFVLILLVIFVLGSVLGSYYSRWQIIDDFNALESIIMFTLLYSNIIPISLFIVIDIIRALQGIIVRRKNPKYVFNIDDLNENLGQIDYLIADKTGTLTERKLVVKAFIIENVRFDNFSCKETSRVESSYVLLPTSPRQSGESRSLEVLKANILDQSSDSVTSHYMKCLCLCHSLYQHKGRYLGLSEEMVTLQAMTEMGYNLTIGEDKIYNLEFDETVNSFKMIIQYANIKKQKKSRVILEDLKVKDGILYVKGTPNEIFPLLNITPKEFEDIEATLLEAESKYMKCTMLAYKKLSISELKEIKKKKEWMNKSLLNTENRIELLFRQAEKNLKYLGILCTAEEINESTLKVIKNLQLAGIKLILTSSDSHSNTLASAKETGIIDSNSSLIEILDFSVEFTLQKFLLNAIKNVIFEPGHKLILKKSNSNFHRMRSRKSHQEISLNEGSPEPQSFWNNQQLSQSFLLSHFTKIDLDVENELNKSFEPDLLDYSVIIDQSSFNLALQNEESRKIIVCILACARSVCFCNLMPRDKGNVVKLLKENFITRPVVAVVGCDESDICMLQLSDIGIGINQDDENLAMNYSDIIIPHFNEIDNLVLKQGHYFYYRISRALLLFFYKNCLLTILIVSLTFYCSFSGTSIFNTSLLIGYNIFFTTLPILVIGTVDEDIEPNDLKASPQLYQLGINNSMFTWKKALSYFVIAIVQGLITILLTIYIFPMTAFSNGQAENFLVFGTSIYIVLIVTVLMQIYIDTYCYHLVYYFSMFFSVIFLIIFISIVSRTDFPDPELYGVGEMLSKSGFSMISICFTSLCCIVPVYWYYSNLGIFNQELTEKLKQSFSFKLNEKFFKYSKSLGTIYRQSSAWKSHIKEDKFELSKWKLKFKIPYIENGYAKAYIYDHLILFRFVIGLIFIFLFIWTIFGVTIMDEGFTYTLTRVVLDIACGIFLYLMSTQHFRMNYKFYILMFILIGIFAEFAVEVEFSRVSVLGSALVSSIIFLVLNVHWINIFLLNLINLLLAFIKTGLEYSGTESSLVILSIYMLYLSIAFTSAIQGYFSELAKRKEHILMYEEKASIEKMNSILKIMLPPFVRKRVVDGARYIAEDQGEVTVLFCDICDFEKITKDYQPHELTAFLDSLYSIFDNLCETIGVTKIETVGKTYMACAGLLDSEAEIEKTLRRQAHPSRVIELAFAMIEEVSNIQLKNESFLQVKIGINSGRVTAGVVGYHKPQFSLVGDTVNTASRMCSTLTEYNSIQISESTYDLVKDLGYCFTAKTVYAKGKGNITVYIISEIRPDNPLDNLELLQFPANSNLGQSTTEISITDSPRIDSNLKIKNRDSNAWRVAVLRKSSNKTIRFSPFLGIFNQESIKEQEFIEKRLQLNIYPTYSSLIISVITFTILLLLSVLQYTIDNTIHSSAVITCRVIVVLFLIYLSFYYNKQYKEIYFRILTMVCVGLMYVTVLLNITYESSIPADSLGLEILYIILLICQTSQISILPMLLLNILIFIPWIILAIMYSNTKDHLINALIAAGFLSVNLRTAYSKEKNDRMNFNLSLLSAKEINDNKALLEQMLPAHALEYLENDQAFTDRLFAVTILFADIVGFTQWSSNKSPNEIVEMLSNLFSRFDRLCVELNVYKVHTIGDCYVVIGITTQYNRNPSLECLKVLKMAYKMIGIIKEENARHSSDLKMRIGIHTGEIVAGIIGSSIVRYDIWGPDVLIANKMESCGAEWRVKVSEATKEMLESSIYTDLNFEESKTEEISAISATVKTYFVDCPDVDSLPHS